jgi:branched-chain amino acid transport system permease protein
VSVVATALFRSYRRLREWKHSAVLFGALLFGGLALVPLLSESLPNWISLEVLIITLIWATAAQAWNIMSGFTGQFSFGHVAFFGIGAYVTQKLLIDFGLNPWAGMLVAASVAALYGLTVGFLTFRYDLKGHYFALATLAAAELVRTSISNMSEFNGTRGMYRPRAETYADGPGLIAFQFEGITPYFYVILAFLLIVTVVAYLLKNSWIGLYFLSIREDERAAASLGVPTFRYKMLGFGISTFFTAWVGAFWSMYFLTIRPGGVVGLFKNVEILLPAIVGGLGTIIGPIIGSFIITPSSEFARSIFTDVPALDRVIYGIFLVAIVLYSPKGAIKWPERLRNLLGRSRHVPWDETQVEDVGETDDAIGPSGSGDQRTDTQDGTETRNNE